MKSGFDRVRVLKMNFRVWPNGPWARSSKISARADLYRGHQEPLLSNKKVRFRYGQIIHRFALPHMGNVKRVTTVLFLFIYFICRSFNDAVSSSDYIAADDRMNN
jgi:hypothetical protein